MDHLKSDSAGLQRSFKRYTSGKEIPQSYAMAIARQERLELKSEITVGASGLMQIMPGTATHTVKMFSIPGYSSPGQLLDPETNINIAPVICNMFISSLAITVFSPQQLITPDQGGANLAWQQRLAYRRSGICREYSVLRDARLCEERAGL
ncbi:transglycosylase SLT domain-containing protein [Escherichia coli]